MAAAAGDGLTVATDVAEALVRGGMPFRQAHEEVAARDRRRRAVHRPDARGGDRGARRRAGMPGRYTDQLAALEELIAASRAHAGR